jgi:site-specific recombinase XerD
MHHQTILREKSAMPSAEEDALDEVRALLAEFEHFLSGKAGGTTDAYLRTARQLISWLAQRPGTQGPFQPQQLTQTIVELYLAHLEQDGLSLNHRARVKSSISTFAQFLIEEKQLLQRNPTRGIELPSVPLPAPQYFSQQQRGLLRLLGEQAGDQRGAALFALGYWAGCRVSELSWLQMAQTHVGSTTGWLRVGDRGSKQRKIDLMSQAREPLYAYLQATGDLQRPYVFTSQRSARLTEEGIYYWFRMLKAQAPTEHREVIDELSFNDLRHDFAHRAREAGWALEEVAFYLGDVTTQGVPAALSIVPYAQVSREQLKRKLEDIKG